MGVLGVLVWFVVVCAGVVGLWLGVPQLCKAWSIRRLRRLCVQRGVVVLTYDDGPSGLLTPEILDLLRARGARATFFVLGGASGSRPDIVRRLLAEGHEAGTHAFGHLHAWRSLPWRSVADIRHGVSARASFGGVGHRLFRPPYGKSTLLTMLYGASRGLVLCWWTHDSGDTHRHLPDPRVFASRVIAEGGGVALLHDHDRSEHADGPARRRYALEVTAALLDAAGSAGLRVVPLGVVLGVGLFDGVCAEDGTDG